MQLILLSGGSGKRLWPLSNDSRSKQFLKVLPDPDNLKQPISMIQRVWQQLKRANLAEKTIVSTGKSQVDLIDSQLGKNIPLIIEPSRRDTYAAIALAAVYLYSEKGIGLDEAVAVLPVDPFVNDSFFSHISALEDVICQSNADLVLIGIQPTFPSEKYGYIVPEKEKEGELSRVQKFIEKPNEELARNLLEQGALWNAGVFAFKLKYIINHLLNQKIPVNYDELVKGYTKIPINSFDYEVVEKSSNIVVSAYNGQWKDLGTWNTLSEEMKIPQIGKGSISSDCENVHVINELDIPVSVLGLSNLIVAISPDGILVSDKDASPRVKEIAKEYNNRPMYEERRWGWYRVLDYIKLDDGNEVLTKRINVSAGKNLSYQKHQYRSEVWTIISGTGKFALNEKIYSVKQGDVLQISVGALHGIKAIEDLEIIEVQTGSQLIEEDIVRVFMDWEEVEAHCSE
ncbi:sugar phosphate nucleotidyltransferase [Robertmurraya beringensis]|uniref:Sugar phosphate nucleotidyltransferase n=1 Tax=Robertmurraya beringensis TaxID=641660 RepID=A0ABV6KTJ7_9BACI